MNKKSRLGSDPLSWIKDTREKKPAKQQASKSARQKASKTGRRQSVKPEAQKTSKTDLQLSFKEETQKYSKPATKKATYLIEPGLIKDLKILSAETDRDLSNLVSEAIKDLIEKYSQ